MAKRYEKGGLAHIDCLAQAEEIPANYLVQILNDLRSGGLIVSRRGKKGGYALARSPSDVTLSEIIRVMDGELLGYSLNARGESGAGVSRVWREVVEALEEKTDEYSLEAFLHVDPSHMYYI